MVSKTREHTAHTANYNSSLNTEFIISDERYPDDPASPFKKSLQVRKLFDFIKSEAEAKGLTLVDSEKARHHQSLVRRRRTTFHDRNKEKRER